MDDTFIISNFHALCRLCLNKSALMVSIFTLSPDDDPKFPLPSKIAACLDSQVDINDGLPEKICYKCLFQLDKFIEFRHQCITSEMRLKQITIQFDNSNSSELSNNNDCHESKKKIKNEEFIVGDRVVMVVDPNMECDSSDESDNGEQQEPEVTERDNTPDGETITDSFLKNVFMCQYCDHAFISRDSCREHEENYHDANTPYNCIECSLVFAERSQYIQHTKQVHGNDKPYHCPECDKSFGRRSDLRKHSIVHTGVRPYQCQYCLKSFSRNTNLSKHLRIHAGRKPHVCPLCPRSFVEKGDLKRHIVVHSEMKPYACRKCPLTFGRKDKLLKHELRHGSRTPYKTVEDQNDNETHHDMVVSVNPYGNLMTSPQQGMSEHANTDYEYPRIPDHISGENTFVTQGQKIPSTSGNTARSPIKGKGSTLKNRPKNIKCHQCPKRLSSLDAYKTHVSIAHIGSRGFQCKVCFKKFARKRELDRHATVHINAKSFACTQCDQTFTRKDKLVKHEESHEYMVVDMPCIECGATFEKKADLVAHIKSHFSEDCEERETKNLKTETESTFPLDSNYYDLET